MDSIYHLDGNINQLQTGDDVYALLTNWDGTGYESEYRKATFLGINKHNRIVIKYKYMSNIVTFQDKTNITVNNHSMNIPSVIVPTCINEQNEKPNSWAKCFPADLFAVIASFLRIKDYINFKATSKSIYKDWKDKESMAELYLEKKNICSDEDYDFYNKKLAKCNQLKYLCVSGKDLGRHRLKIPESVTILRIFGGVCHKIQLGLGNPKLKIKELHLINFGDVQIKFVWKKLDDRLFANLKSIYLSNCHFEKSRFQRLNSFNVGIGRDFPKGLEGFCNVSNRNYNQVLFERILKYASLKSLGFTDHRRLKIESFDFKKLNNLKQFQIVSPIHDGKLTSILSNVPSLEKIYLQDLRRLMRDSNRNAQHTLLNEIFTKIFKLNNLNEIRIIDVCPNSYSIHESISYALYDETNNVGKKIKIEFLYLVSLNNPAVDCKQIHIDVERITKMVSKCYGTNNFIIIMKYKCGIEPRSKGVGLSDIIKVHQKDSGSLRKRLKCIDNNICLKVNIDKTSSIKFTIYSAHCKVYNIGVWMFPFPHDTYK